MRKAVFWVVLLGAVCVLGVVGAYMTRPSPALDETRDFSADRSGKWGTEALRDLCEWDGLKTDTWTDSLATISKREGTVCILAPTEPLGSDERAALARWVRAGGHLVVAGESVTPTDTVLGKPQLAGSHQVMAWLGIALKIRKYGAPEEEVQVTKVPKEWGGYNITRLSDDVPPSLVWKGNKAKIAKALKAMGAEDKVLKHLPAPVGAKPGGKLVDADGQVLGMELSLGRGEVDVLSDAELLCNYRLGKADNALLAAAVLLRGKKGPVVFDEYHHGLAPGGKESEAGNVMDWALILLLAAIIIALLPDVFARMGKPRAYSNRPRRTVGEYVRATAWLYQGAGMSVAAMQMLGRDVRRSWANRLGVRPDAPPQEFARAAQQRGLKVGPRLSRALADLAALNADEPMTRSHIMWLGAELTSLKREWANRG